MGQTSLIYDTETGATPAANGWYPRANGSAGQTAAYETDDFRGKVLRFESHTTTDTAKYMIGDYAGDTTNPNDIQFATGNPVLSMWVKGDGASHYLFAVQAVTNLGTRYIYIHATNGTDYQSGSSFYFYIGTGFRAAQWQYLEVDLAARVDALSSGETISQINALFVYAYDLRLDDIKFGEGMLSRSWAQVPGAALGGYLGAQTGAAGAVGVDPWDKYYYHFSDLGTVMATTDADGALLGVYQPDFWGNYRETYGIRPDTMGLTGKFYDVDLELYYFNARWYDSERGIFMSRSDISPKMEEQYLINSADMVNYVDYTGKKRKRVGNNDIPGGVVYYNGAPYPLPYGENCVRAGYSWLTVAEGEYNGNWNKCVSDCVNQQRLSDRSPGNMMAIMQTSVGAGLFGLVSARYIGQAIRAAAGLPHSGGIACWLAKRSSLVATLNGIISSTVMEMNMAVAGIYDNIKENTNLDYCRSHCSSMACYE